MSVWSTRSGLVCGLMVATIGGSILVAAPPERGTPNQSAKPRSFLFFNPRKVETPDTNSAPAENAENTDLAEALQRNGGPASGRAGVKSAEAPAKKPFWSLTRTAAPTEKIHWQSDLKQAHQISANTGKPVLLVLGATWCKPCLKMEREVFTRPEIVSKVMAGFIPVHLDADQNPDLIERLDLDSIPAILVIDRDLQIVRRWDGFQPAAKLGAMLSSVTAHPKVQPVSGEDE